MKESVKVQVCFTKCNKHYLGVSKSASLQKSPCISQLHCHVESDTGKNSVFCPFSFSILFTFKCLVKMLKHLEIPQRNYEMQEIHSILEIYLQNLTDS